MLSTQPMFRSKLASERRKQPNQIQIIQTMVAEFYQVDPSLMTLPSDTIGARRMAVAWPRQVAMYMCHMETNVPVPEIEKAFNRKRGIMRFSDKVVQNAREVNPNVNTEIMLLILNIREAFRKL